MKDFLKKKIVIKKTVGQMLRSTLVGSIIFIIVLFSSIYFYNADIISFLEKLINIFNSVGAGEISIFELGVLFAPIFIILFLTIRLGLITMYLDNNKK